MNASRNSPSRGGAWIARGRDLLAAGRPLVMGILNATPDSFSDGGVDRSVAEAIARAWALAGQGADILDVGGESSRPGSDPVAADEEIRRVLPIVETLAGPEGLPISVDTTKPEVARRTLEAGAAVVNDITALGDPRMAEVVAEFGAGVVLMHMQGRPRTMQVAPAYGNVVDEVRDFLAGRIEAAERAGIPRERVAIDPGIGFGKTIDHNLALLRNLDRFASLGCTVLIGTSRKRFLGDLTGRDVGDRAVASVVSSLLAVQRGAGVVRVHDVGPMRDALRIWGAIDPDAPGTP